MNPRLLTRDERLVPEVISNWARIDDTGRHDPWDLAVVRRAFGRSSDEFCTVPAAVRPELTDLMLVHGVRSNFRAAVRAAAVADVTVRGGAGFSAAAQQMLFCLDAVLRAETLYREERKFSPRNAAFFGLLRWLHTRGTPWPSAAGAAAEVVPRPTGWLVADSRLFEQRDSDSVCTTALARFAAEGVAGSFHNRVNDVVTASVLQRAIALSVWSDDPGDVFAQAVANALLTHGGPDAFLSAGAFALVVNVLLRGGDVVDASHLALEELKAWPENENVRLAFDVAWDAVEHRSPDMLAAAGDPGSAPGALAAALAAVRTNPEDFDGPIGFLSGTCPAAAGLAGAMLGAAHGDAIVPAQRLATLELRDVVDRLAEDVVAVRTSPEWPSSWSTDYPAF